MIFMTSVSPGSLWLHCFHLLDEKVLPPARKALASAALGSCGKMGMGSVAGSGDGVWNLEKG